MRPSSLRPMQTDPAYARETRPNGSWYGAVEFEDGQVLFLGALGLESHVRLDGMQTLTGWYEAGEGEWFVAWGEENEIFEEYAMLLKERFGAGGLKKPYGCGARGTVFTAGLPKSVCSKSCTTWVTCPSMYSRWTMAGRPASATGNRTQSSPPAWMVWQHKSGRLDGRPAFGWRLCWWCLPRGCSATIRIGCCMIKTAGWSRRDSTGASGCMPWIPPIPKRWTG